MKPLEYKTIENIAHEWDRIAPIRSRLIRAGEDISFAKVLVPGILSALDKCDLSNLVDCGCGTGALTLILSEMTGNVTGIDISKVSIEIANQIAKERGSAAKFYNISIGNYSALHPASATTCVANMVLTNVINLHEEINYIYKMLVPGGSFVFTISHPCFWPTYCGYWDKPWFAYDGEIILESDFSITRCKNIGISTYIHRPLTMYFECLKECGFNICEMRELYPNQAIENYTYTYPRFICFRCIK